MNGLTDPGWKEANRRHLWASMALARLALPDATDSDDDSMAKGSADSTTREAHERAALAAESLCLGLGTPPRLRQLCEALTLSSMASTIVLWCTLVELEPACRARFSELQGGLEGRPTFRLALRYAPPGPWGDLTPNGPLRRFSIVDLAPGGGVLDQALRLDERALHFLMGHDNADERLSPFIHPIEPLDSYAPTASRRAAIDRLAGVWQPQGRYRFAQICGGDPEEMAEVVCQAALRRGWALHGLRASALPSTASERDGLKRLWSREALLERGALIIEVKDAQEAEACVAFAQDVAGPVCLVSEEPVVGSRGGSVRLTLPKSTFEERTQAWRRTLGPAARLLDGAVERLSAQFRLGPTEVEAVSSLVPSATRDDPRALADALWDACRSHARGRLDGLAQRMDTHAGWEALVLPPEQRSILEEIALHLRHSATVYDQWGFRRRQGRGLGLCALFAGPSGTGKTLAAEVLAAELRLDLIRVDLSQVVSKYIGETEKNLARIFNAAERGGAVLLFDEADALFGKRTEVRDSHDRYANVEVSYLLQRMEAYEGLAILTTNMKTAIDKAFLRRIRFIVEFPFPDAVSRAEIWRRIFPSETPTQKLLPELLANLQVSGGHIRNIAMNAAFLAADEGAPVSMTHLHKAAHVECRKMERSLKRAEVAGWV